MENPFPHPDIVVQLHTLYHQEALARAALRRSLHNARAKHPGWFFQQRTRALRWLGQRLIYWGKRLEQRNVGQTTPLHPNM